MAKRVIDTGGSERLSSPPTTFVKFGHLLSARHFPFCLGVCEGGEAWRNPAPAELGSHPVAGRRLFCLFPGILKAESLAVIQTTLPTKQGLAP